MPGNVLVTPPALEPLTLAETKNYLRVEHSVDDALITTLITAARQSAESFMRRALITQTYTLWLNMPLASRHISMPVGGVLAISAVSTFDEADIETTLPATSYLLDNTSSQASIIIHSEASLPTTRTVNGLKITYSAGFGASAAAVPDAIKQGLLLHCAQLYQRRGDEADSTALPESAQHLYHPYRLFMVR